MPVLFRRTNMVRLLFVLVDCRSVFYCLVYVAIVILVKSRWIVYRCDNYSHTLFTMRIAGVLMYFCSVDIHYANMTERRILDLSISLIAPSDMLHLIFGASFLYRSEFHT